MIRHYRVHKVTNYLGQTIGGSEVTFPDIHKDDWKLEEYPHQRLMVCGAILDKRVIARILPFLQTFAETGSLSGTQGVKKITNKSLSSLKDEIKSILRKLESEKDSSRSFMPRILSQLNISNLYTLIQMEDSWGQDKTKKWIEDVLVSTGKYRRDLDGAIVSF